MHLDAFAAANISSSLLHVRIYEDYSISWLVECFVGFAQNGFMIQLYCFDLNYCVDFRRWGSMHVT